MEIKKKNGFSSGIGFILAAAGSAVGLGNLWAFPYKTSVNGGAAFVFLYIISVIFIGIITMIAEIYIGKRSHANPVTSFSNVNKHFGWLGLFAIIIPFIIACYYSILGGYTLRYCFNSFGTNAGTVASFTGNVPIVIVCTLSFIVIALIVILCGVQKGIEQASKILMPTLFLILVAIVIYCLCLGEGVSEGVAYYLKPDFSKVTFKTVLAAMSQAFYSLSLGMGIMVSYGSYTDNKIDLVKSTGMICIFDTIVALLAGLAIFPALFHYQSVNAGSELSQSGIMLMFDSLPYVFEGLGLFGKFVSFFFFAMVAIAALTSVISLYEVVTQTVIQKFHINRKIAITIVAIISFAISIPIGMSLGNALNGVDEMQVFGMDLLTFFDTVSNSVLMPICALGGCVVVGWLLGEKKSAKDWFSVKYLNNTLIDDGLKLGKLMPIFAFMVKYITPVLILIVEVCGLIDIIWPNGVFSMDGLWITIISLSILIVAIIVYIAFFKDKYNGTNEDEKITQSFKKKVTDKIAVDDIKEENTIEEIDETKAKETSEDSIETINNEIAG